jgi:hypothetical protein
VKTIIANGKAPIAESKDPGRNELARWIDPPRVWEDVSGGIHFVIPEILKLVDMPATPENIEVAMQITRATVGRAAAEAGSKVVERHSQED